MPSTIAEGVERHILLFYSFGFVGIIQYFYVGINGFGNKDSWDLYWYNNAAAIGNQIYPKGLHKYYDLFSFFGIFRYFWDYVYVLFCSLLSPIVPFDIITMILTLDMSSWFQAFIIELNPIFYMLCCFFSCNLPNKGW